MVLLGIGWVHRLGTMKVDDLKNNNPPFLKRVYLKLKLSFPFDPLKETIERHIWQMKGPTNCLLYASYNRNFIEPDSFISPAVSTFLQLGVAAVITNLLLLSLFVSAFVLQTHVMMGCIPDTKTFSALFSFWWTLDGGEHLPLETACERKIIRRFMKCGTLFA